MAYQPDEDSYLLSEAVKSFLKNNSPKKILDLGSGSGIQAQTAIKAGIDSKNLTLADIDKEAIKTLKKKFPKSKVIHSDLFSNLKDKFDLIVFNPPYLPENKFDKNKDTSGGEKGDETILKFLKQAKFHLNPRGKILLLTSSLTPMARIKKEFSNYKAKKIATKKIFFEELYVYELGL